MRVVFWELHAGELLGKVVSLPGLMLALLQCSSLTMEPSYNGHLTVEQEDGKNLGPQ